MNISSIILSDLYEDFFSALEKSSRFFVRMIGLEPTCREALAPETSVSTISPHPPAKSGTKIQNVFEIERNL